MVLRGQSLLTLHSHGNTRKFLILVKYLDISIVPDDFCTQLGKNVTYPMKYPQVCWIHAVNW